jgi:hypothetical protein
MAHGINGSFSKKIFFLKSIVSKEKKGVTALFLFTSQNIPADEIRVKINPVFECRCLTSQLWTARVSPKLAITGNVLNYCSRFHAINFHSLDDETIELAMSMVHYEEKKTDRR